MKISRYRGMAAVSAAVLAGAVWAQFGGLATQEWSTSGGDAQRYSWIRKDALISKSAMSTGKFGFLWKLKVSNQPRQSSYFSRPVLVGNAMGTKGFRSLTVLAGASNTVFAVDNDFGVMYWEKQFDAAIPASSTVPCPGGMTAAATRATNPNPAALASGRPGIRSPYRSTLGEPRAGAPMASRGYLPGGGGGPANAGECRMPSGQSTPWLRPPKPLRGKPMAPAWRGLWLSAATEQFMRRSAMLGQGTHATPTLWSRWTRRLCR